MKRLRYREVVDLRTRNHFRQVRRVQDRSCLVQCRCVCSCCVALEPARQGSFGEGDRPWDRLSGESLGSGSEPFDGGRGCCSCLRGGRRSCRLQALWGWHEVSNDLLCCSLCRRSKASPERKRRRSCRAQSCTNAKDQRLVVLVHWSSGLQQPRCSYSLKGASHNRGASADGTPTPPRHTRNLPCSQCWIPHCGDVSCKLRATEPKLCPLRNGGANSLFQTLEVDVCLVQNPDPSECLAHKRKVSEPLCYTLKCSDACHSDRGLLDVLEACAINRPRLRPHVVDVLGQLTPWHRRCDLIRHPPPARCAKQLIVAPVSRGGGFLLHHRCGRLGRGGSDQSQQLLEIRIPLRVELRQLLIVARAADFVLCRIVDETRCGHGNPDGGIIPGIGGIAGKLLK